MFSTITKCRLSLMPGQERGSACSYRWRHSHPFAAPLDNTPGFTTQPRSRMADSCKQKIHTFRTATGTGSYVTAACSRLLLLQGIVSGIFPPSVSPKADSWLNLCQPLLTPSAAKMFQAAQILEQSCWLEISLQEQPSFP